MLQKVPSYLRKILESGLFYNDMKILPMSSDRWFLMTSASSRFPAITAT